MVDKAIETAEKALNLAKRDRDYFRNQLQKFQKKAPAVN
jgi:hypothetical protein